MVDKLNPAANAGIKAATDSKSKDAKLKKACADFEAVFLNQMFQAMRVPVQQGGMFGGSHGKDMYESMFFQEVANQCARSRGVGIAEALYRQLSPKLEPGEK